MFFFFLSLSLSRKGWGAAEKQKKRSSFHFSKAGLKWRGHCARADVWPGSLFGDAGAILPRVWKGRSWTLLGYGQGVGPPVVQFQKVHIWSYPLITAVLLFCLDLCVSSTSQSYSKHNRGPAGSALLLLFSMHVARNMKWNCCVIFSRSKGYIWVTHFFLCHLSGLFFMLTHSNFTQTIHRLPYHAKIIIVFNLMHWLF